MSDDDFVERTRVTHGPEGERREVYRERSSGVAGWWIAAIVAVVAVVGLALIFASQNRQQALQQAKAEGAAQATLEMATANAQRSAAQASQAAQSAMDSTARASQRAAETAQSAANQTAQAAQSTAENASDAARDAAAQEPAAPQP
jgi:hypothetical protein